MQRWILWLALGSLALAEDTWDKVKGLKSGTEIRVVVADSKQPVVGLLDEADDERLVLVVKNEQKAIQKADILGVDARPMSNKRGPRFTKSTTVSNDVTNPKPPVANTPGPLNRPGGPSGSTGTSYSVGSKPEFEKVYRKQVPAQN